MSLFLEFHLIQNFAPSNLNRDDTGAPKDALFGGHRRARVSSQCWKRATRLAVRDQNLLPLENQGIRTQRLRELLVKRLADRDPEQAAARVEAALGAAGLKVKDDGKTEYLLFLGESEVSRFASLVEQHWDDLSAASEKAPAKDAKDAKEEKGAKEGKKEAKEAKRAAKAGLPPEVVRKARELLDGGKAVDVALFGRMLADLPAVNRDAACQVAHAISSHRVEREFDYFTAVDDFGGAGMIGQVEFNSATLYRYAVLDVAKLQANLQGDRELALVAVEAFTRAFSLAIPSGKQNTFAAHNSPAFIGVCLRHGTPLNLANAFEKPVVPRADVALTEQSVERLAGHESQLAAVYGSAEDRWISLDLTGRWPTDNGDRARTLPDLAERSRALAAAALGA